MNFWFLKFLYIKFLHMKQIFTPEHKIFTIKKRKNWFFCKTRDLLEKKVELWHFNVGEKNSSRQDFVGVVTRLVGLKVEKFFRTCTLCFCTSDCLFSELDDVNLWGCLAVHESWEFAREIDCFEFFQLTVKLGDYRSNCCFGPTFLEKIAK